VAFIIYLIHEIICCLDILNLVITRHCHRQERLGC